MSKPSFLTESLGRRFLSIAVVSVLTLVTAVSGVTVSQENGAGDRRAAFRRLVQSYVQTGRAEYDKRYFEQAEKTFLMTKPYREYLTPAAREQLDALLKKTQTAIAERKNALETFPAVNSLIKLDKLTEAKKRLEDLETSAFLTRHEQAQIAEVLRQLDIQIADDQTHSKKVNDRKLLATKLEKIAEEARKPGEQLNERNQKIYEIYLSSMEYMRAGQLEKARPGFVRVAASSLIPPLMKKTIEGHIAKIDRLLPQKITSRPVAEEKKPELIAVVEPKVVEPQALELRVAQPRLTQSEAAEAEPGETETTEADPGETETAEAEPAETETAEAEPAETEVTEAEPAEPEKPTPAPKITAATPAGEGTYIENMNKKRNILRTYTATVVNDAAAKARTRMDKGEFEKARQSVEAAVFVVNENQIHLGEELFKAHSTRLTALTDEIAALEAEKARLAEQQRREAAAADQRQFREQMEIDRQNRIAELMENAVAYQKQQRYEAAMGQLQSLLAIDPQHDAALTLKDLLEATIYFRKQLEVERDTNRQTAEVLLKTDQSQIPYADEITYPKNWREIIEKPTRQPDQPIGLDPIDAEVYKRMDQVVDLSNLSQAMTFEQVVTELENAVEPPLQIQPNWKDLLEIADIEPATPAMMDPLTGVKLRKALEVLVAGVSSEFAKVDYVVDEGVIVIATVDALPTKMVTRVYDITDLVGQPSQGGMMGGMMGGMGGMMGGMGGMMGGMGGMMGGQMGGYGGQMGGMGGMMGGQMGGMMGGQMGGYGGQMGGMGGQMGGYGGQMGGMGGMMGGQMGGYGGQIGGMGGQMGGMGGMMGGMGGMMGGMGGMQQAQSLLQLIQESIDPESWYDLSDTGEGTVTPYPIQQPKKLSVFNTHEVHEEIDKLLDALRKALGHQVSIEARFLVVSENFLEDIGLDVDFSINAGTKWGQISFEQNSTTFAGAEATSVPLSMGGIGASGSVGGGYGSILDDLQVSFLLRATQAHKDAKSMEANIATVLSGESASFMVNRSFEFPLPPTQTQGSQFITGGGQQTQPTGTQPNYMPVNQMNSLTITPIITHDKKNVLLNITTSKNEFLGVRTTTIEAPIIGGTQAGAQLFEYEIQTPEQEFSNLTTRVSVPDNGTLLLGGQRITAQVETEAGVPILSKIPLVGRLFRNRSKVKDSKILLILVKPVIILQEEREAEAIAAMEGEI